MAEEVQPPIPAEKRGCSLCIHITILAYFLTGTLNWQVLWGKEKYLLNSLHKKLKYKVSLKKCKQ